MEPRSSKPNSRPTVRRPTGDTNRESVKDLPLNASDAFLGPPQSPDEVGWLGPYRILGVLGRGGMGAVYRAEDPRLKRQLAIKVLLPELAADARAKARFRREAQAQAQVDHDNIIPIYEVEETNGVVYIAMPLLRGQTLGSALKQNRRPPVAELVRIGREVAEGLAAAHAVGLIHRDIKPGNIWLEGSKRRVKILDFGLARSDKTFDPKNDALTAANAIMGTPAYMAPEQARSQPTDNRSDIFSLGVVLYEMATGQKPFTGDSVFDIMAEVVSKDPPPVQLLVPDFPPKLSDLIDRMLAKNPEQRPRDCNTVAEELQSIENSLTTLPVVVMPLSEIPGVPDVWADIETTYAESIVTPRTREHEERTPPPKWLWPTVGGVACLALVAVLAVVFFQSKPKQPEVAQEQNNPTPPKPKPNPPPKPKDGTPISRDKRLVADWILKQRNGEQKSAVTIQLNGAAEKLTITDSEKLPATSFTVVGVSLAHLNDADEPQLANTFAALEDLDLLTFKGTAWTDA